jgi:hypothetical protein
MTRRRSASYVILETSLQSSFTANRLNLDLLQEIP